MESRKVLLAAMLLLSVSVIVVGFSSCGQSVAGEEVSPGYTSG